MKIVSYIHASRCTLPCGGVGRHANNMILNLGRRLNVDCSVLYASSAGEDQSRSEENFPLYALPHQRIPFNELLFERILRVTRFPKLDQFLDEGVDWVYSPMETMVPTGKAKSVMTLHDIAAFETTLPWSNTAANKRARFTNSLWLRRAFKKLDLLLTVSEFSKRRIVDVFGVDADRIAVIGNGVGDEFFRAGDDLTPLDEKSGEIIIIGGLRYKKGADSVFAVADELKARKSDLKIVAIGQNERKYEERAETYSNVETLGMIPDHEMISRLSQAHALMMLSPYEGFGIPPLEAMACGTLSVVSNLASLPEIVGENGFVVPPSDAGGIADILAELSTKSKTYSEMISQGREHARQFTWDKCTDRLLKALSR